MDRRPHLQEARLEEFEAAKKLGHEEFIVFVATHSLGEIWDQIMEKEEGEDRNGARLFDPVAMRAKKK